MSESASLPPPQPSVPARQLKIEAHGDPWKGLVKPKLRLIGRWLQRAGFQPGGHVQVTCLAPGVLEVRAAGAIGAGQPEHSNSPF